MSVEIASTHAPKITNVHRQHAIEYFEQKQQSYNAARKMGFGAHMTLFGGLAYFAMRSVRRSDADYSTLGDLDLPLLQNPSISELPIISISIAIVALGAVLLPLTWAMMQSGSVRKIFGIALFFLLLCSGALLGSVLTQSAWVEETWSAVLPSYISMGAVLGASCALSMCIAVPFLSSSIKRPEALTEDLIEAHAATLARQEQAAQSIPTSTASSRRRRRR